MPNWCNNTFEVTGDAETIDKFEKFLNEKDGKNWFDFFAPTLKELEDNGWYEWNISNWGCKWNCDAQDWTREGDTISFWFDSPWGPPTNLYETLTNMGLQVFAEYHEEGMCFIGRYDDGYNESYEYEYGNVDSLDDIPEELVENWNLRDRAEEWEQDDSEFEDEDD